MMPALCGTSVHDFPTPRRTTWCPLPPPCCSGTAAVLRLAAGLDTVRHARVLRGLLPPRVCLAAAAAARVSSCAGARVSRRRGACSLQRVSVGCKQRCEGVARWLRSVLRTCILSLYFISTSPVPGVSNALVPSPGRQSVVRLHPHSRAPAGRQRGRTSGLAPDTACLYCRRFFQSSANLRWVSPKLRRLLGRGSPRSLAFTPPRRSLLPTRHRGRPTTCHRPPARLPPVTPPAALRCRRRIRRLLRLRLQLLLRRQGHRHRQVCLALCNGCMLGCMGDCGPLRGCVHPCCGR